MTNSTISSNNKFSLNIQSNIFLGFFILIPLWLTIYVGYIIFILIAQMTFPLLSNIYQEANTYFVYSVSFVLSMVLIYCIGVLARMWIGRMLLAFINTTLANIPVVGTFYKALQQLIDAFNNQDKHGQKVVLVNFPSEEMKTIGFIIKVFEDGKTKQKLATVYVPTTPNPTSGYLEIVPLDKTIALDWTFEEAMSFIISGGSSMPDKEVRFS